MKTKKILCLCLITFVTCFTITNTSALEKDIIASPRYGSHINYEYNFCNYQLTSASIYSIIGSNGGISITLNPNVKNSKYTMTFELVKDGIRTGKKKTVAMLSGQFVSWGELPSGKYQIRLTSTYTDCEKNKYVSGSIQVYYGD